MADMNDRKDAFENKFAHDEALKFKATARRNKLVGLWAAEKIGKSGADADAYAKEVVMADFEEVGDEDVFRKLRGELPATVSDHQIRHAMEELMSEAIEQIQNA